MSGYEARIRRLAAAARERRDEFEVSPPDDDTAMEILRSGVAPVVSLYIEARTADDNVAFEADELEALHRAINDWLRLYARCYGVEHDADVTVREAAEMVVKTHNIRDTAQLLTGVPAR